MKPRFALGANNTPVHLASIQRVTKGAGVLLFSGGTLGTRRVAFHSELDLRAKLRVLLKRAVPLSVGGQVPGPADEVGALIESGKLMGPYVQISWSRPGHWDVREMVSGAVEWQAAASADMFATINFDPESSEWERPDFL